MITFEKFNNELIDFLVEKQSEIYVLKKDNIIIGYGKINNDVNNRIEIFIISEYRGNGYGKELFSNLVKTFNTIDIIYLTFENANIIAKRIVEKFGAKQDSIINGIIKYVLPISLSPEGEIKK